MAVYTTNHFTLLHIDRLPQPIVLGLASIVLFMHGILVAAALGNIHLVELGGNTGSGNGGSAGNKTLFVSVLQNSPSPSGTPVARQPPGSAEKPADVKKRKQPELITTTSTTQKTAPENKTIRKFPVEQASPLAGESRTAHDSRPSSAQTMHSAQESNAADGAGTGSVAGNGAGKGVGQGEGENTGRGIGADGSGNGITRSVSLSRLRYKRAVKPEYPPRSIQKHESGQVNVRVIIDTAGRVHDARVVLSSGFSRLDEAALRAARHSTFHPYTEHGRPLFAMAIIPYRFNLSNQ